MSYKDRKKEINQITKGDQQIIRKNDFALNREAKVDQEIADSRRKTVDYIKNAVTNFQLQKDIIDIICEEKRFVLELGERGSAETFNQLDKLETRISQKKEIYWDTLKAYAVRNKNLAESLSEIQSEISKLSPPQATKIHEYMEPYPTIGKWSKDEVSSFVESYKETGSLSNENIGTITSRGGLSKEEIINIVGIMYIEHKKSNPHNSSESVRLNRYLASYSEENIINSEKRVHQAHQTEEKAQRKKEARKRLQDKKKEFEEILKKQEKEKNKE